jgi:hypothetical protein
MKVASWLLRLMTRMRLAPGIKLGPEDRLAIEVADACRAWTLQGRLRAVWWHSAGEVGGANAQARMALAKALGLIAGTPDLVFIGRGEAPAAEPVRFGSLHRALLIELKAPKGRRTDNQADFAAWASHNDIAYLICRSFDEVEEALVKHGLLTPVAKPDHK